MVCVEAAVTMAAQCADRAGAVDWPQADTTGTQSMAAITSLQTDSWQVALIIAAHNAADAELASASSRGEPREYGEAFTRIYQAMVAGLQGRRAVAERDEDDDTIPTFGPRANRP